MLTLSFKDSETEKLESQNMSHPWLRKPQHSKSSTVEPDCPGYSHSPANSVLIGKKLKLFKPSCPVHKELS